MFDVKLFYRNPKVTVARGHATWARVLELPMSHLAKSGDKLLRSDQLWYCDSRYLIGNESKKKGKAGLRL